MVNIETHHFKSVVDIKSYIELKKPTLFHGSQTSTVVPYEKLSEFCERENWDSFIMGNLNQLPKVCELGADGLLTIRGPVTWKEGREYCQTKGRTIMTSPTEELAALLSGIATSCTGERCFGFGTYRDHLQEVTYMDHKGNLKVLNYERPLEDHEFFQEPGKKLILKKYQSSYEQYRDFKNAPFPRLERETDLMTGTEGQLGVIVEAKIKTTPLRNVTYIFLALPKWEQDFTLHLRIFEKVQNLRDKIFACELIDENSWSYLDRDQIPRVGKDIIFLEILDESFEVIYETVLSQFPELEEDDVFQVGDSKCKHLRMEIPRAVFEANTRMGVTKKGTDVQVKGNSFSELLKYYQEMTKVGVPYNLFGHFGDAHLHFNYMPKPHENEICQNALENLYHWVKKNQGSPFAEHGIGLLKQKFIKDFFTETHYKMFSYLKECMDPEGIFFPQGFMSMK